VCVAARCVSPVRRYVLDGVAMPAVPAEAGTQAGSRQAVSQAALQVYRNGRDQPVRNAGEVRNVKETSVIPNDPGVAAE